MEDELTFTPMPDLETYDMDDDDTLTNLLSSIKVRIETRDNNEEERARVGRTLRKVQFSEFQPSSYSVVNLHFDFTKKSGNLSPLLPNFSPF